MRREIADLAAFERHFMLKRIISALVAMVIGITALVVDNFIFYLVLISLFSAMGTYELIRAIKYENHKFLTGLCVVFSLGIPSMLSISALRPFWVMTSLTYIAVLLLFMLANHKTIKFVDIAACGAASFAIPISLSCILFVRNLPWYADGGYYPGVYMLVYLLFCAWIGDSGAYFVGTFLGKHKLCPEISPKKTVEGLIGGIITAGIAVTAQCLVYNLLLPSPEMYKMNYAVIIPIGMVASVAGVIGDLTMSVIKRQYDVKDFGNIMPGHGGILDRFDSVLFVAPFIYVFYSFVSPLMQ